MNDIVTLGSQALQTAIDKIKALGLHTQPKGPQAIVTIIEAIKDVDEELALFVARTLAEQVVFDGLVVSKISGIAVGDDYKEINDAFTSIREEAKAAVTDAASGKEKGFFSSITSFFKEATEGDIADRFKKIEDRFEQVTTALEAQLKGEAEILSAYKLFRNALGRSHVAALEIKKKLDVILADAKTKATTAQAAVDAAPSGDEAARVTLALERDAANDQRDREDSRWQVAKDLAESLQIAYSVTEVTMKKLEDTSKLKDRIWRRAVTFFATNRSTLAALKANYSATVGLAQGTNALDAMTDGVNKSLEDLADVTGKVNEKAIRSGYGSTIDPNSVAKLVDALIAETEQTIPLIEEMRDAATRAAADIDATVEEGKQRYSELANKSSQIKLAA
jgi:uncharacterized protein YaaN involved in tellurite resistance